MTMSSESEELCGLYGGSVWLAKLFRGNQAPKTGQLACEENHLDASPKTSEASTAHLLRKRSLRSVWRSSSESMGR